MKEGGEDENAWCEAPEKQSIYLYFRLVGGFKVNNWELLILKPHCIKKKKTHASC